MPRLNPGFRIQTISDDEIALCTQLGDGRRMTHRISGLEADLLRGIEREAPMKEIIGTLRRRHGLSAEACRKRVRGALHVFENDHFICYDENLVVTRSEVRRV
jgi:hypothetical protein